MTMERKGKRERGKEEKRERERETVNGQLMQPLVDGADDGPARGPCS